MEQAIEFGNTRKGLLESKAVWKYALGIKVVPEGAYQSCEVKDNFDRDYIYQVLSEYGQIVDSNDPIELKHHRDFVQGARGSLLVSNAGLGGFLYRLLRKPEVTHVTVVEPNMDLIDVLMAGFSEFSSKLLLVNCSLSEFVTKETFDGEYHPVKNGWQ